MSTDRARYLVDRGGKVVVSLGGAKCAINCAHCYIFAPGFEFFPQRKPEEVVRELATLGPQVSVVYLSGDIEPFLDAERAVEFLWLAATELDVDLLFTTRLILGDVTLRHLESIAAHQRRNGRLLIGCVSIPAWNSFRRIERSRQVAHPAERVRQLGRFAAIPIPTMLAARPILPQELVPREEYKELVENAAPHSTVILGEVLFLDTDGVLEKRLSISVESSYKIAKMSFFDQPRDWKVCQFDEQVAAVREFCEAVDRPFYLRSMPGVDLVRRYWDAETGKLTVDPVYPLPIPDFVESH